MKVTFTRTIASTGMVQSKQIPIGFSWTVCLFGGIPLFMRGLHLYGVALLVLGILTWSLSSIIAAFFINKVCANKLLEDGWSIPESDRQIAASAWGIRFAPAIATN